MSDLITQLNDELAAVIEQTKRSLVHVSNGREGHGAGVVISTDGLILTNAHVVRREVVEVTLPDQTRVTGRVLAHDPDHDLALLKVEATDLPAIEVSDVPEPEPGQWVVAVGHPWGIEGAVTSGVLIDNGRQVSNEARGRSGWLAASLHLRPGNSGGPLVDVHGRLLGINTVMAGLEVGLAIPADEIRRFLEAVSRAGLLREGSLSGQHDNPTIV